MNSVSHQFFFVVTVLVTFTFISTCSNSDHKNKMDPFFLARNRCRAVINLYRAGNGLPPLKDWPEARDCFDGQAESDSKENKPHGSFGRCGERTQNACPGWQGTNLDDLISSCLAAMFAEGPGGGHYENMLSSGVSAVGCGFHYSAERGMWLIQNFK
jgi:hypothetical protein